MLHLYGRRGDSEAEVFVGHRQLPHGDWFVLDLAGSHRLVLVEVKRTLDHSFRGLLGGLVAAWGSGVLVLGGVVRVALVLELTRSAHPSSSSTTTSASASSWREALRLLSGDCCCHG